MPKPLAPVASLHLLPTARLLPTAFLAGASLFLAACNKQGDAPAPETQSLKDASGTANGSAKQAPEKAVNAGQTPTNPLLDDLDDGDPRSAVADGRGGYWYTYADETSTISPTGQFAPAGPGADGSPLAAHMSGQIGNKQYPFAGMGFSLTDPKMNYDLSGCSGVSFKAKKGSAAAISPVRFKLGDAYTVPEGGFCKDCYNDFGIDVLLTEEWTTYEAHFATMKQEPYWGEPRPSFDAAHAMQLQWMVKDPSGPFDVWVDDIRLLGCGEK